MADMFQTLTMSLYSGMALYQEWRQNPNEKPNDFLARKRDAFRDTVEAARTTPEFSDRIPEPGPETEALLDQMVDYARQCVLAYMLATMMEAAPDANSEAVPLTMCSMN